MGKMSIELNKESNDPIYMQLYAILKNMIESGKIKDGERLPSIRSFSKQLGINNVTVVNAYRLLINSGYAFTKTGSGTYANAKCPSKNEQKSSIPVFNEPLSKENSISFADSSPDPRLFPVQDFKKLFNFVMERDGGSAFGYTEPKGYKPLRECLCNMVKNYNVNCDAGDIVVISGAQQGIDIIAKAMIDYGDVIITERPTYTGAIAVFKSRGAAIYDIPINQYGIDLDILEQKLKYIQPKFIYVMSNYQNPTGYSYSKSTACELIKLSEKYGFYIIEDDYLSDLYYCNHKPSLIKSYDYCDRVILVKSFSKIFMPGMRIGFMVVPKKLLQRIAAAKRLTDISTSGFIQRVFELYINENMLDSHMEFIRQKYKIRYEAINECIAKSIKGAEYYTPAGGMHIWVKLPSCMSSNMLYSECLMENLVISPGSSFYIDKADSDYIRLSFASTDTDEIQKGMDILKKAVYKLTREI